MNSVLLGVVIGIVVVTCLWTFGAWLRASRLLANDDRARVVKMTALIEQLLEGASYDRSKVIEVAGNLRDSQLRADRVEGPEGAAADVVARSPEEE